MLITRTSQVSGVQRTLDINITAKQLMAWKLGAKIQDVMPHISSNEREFILTGITEEEWCELFTD